MRVHRFTAEVWQWDARKSAGWYFVSLPPELADDLDAEFGHRAAGFGSLKVEVRLGSSRWTTSIFPSSARATYVLPIKKAVRVQQGLAAGDTAEVALTVL